MASLPPTPTSPEPAGTHSYTLQPTMAPPPPPLQPSASGKVEGQPNGDTIPAEQANPSDDTVAGAGSRQNDQIVQKIEEVLSGALDTELQCKSDVDKNTVKNSSQPTKRSSTAEDEIPRKKSKKNKKHKSKKKKKKKKKRKKEKKHKKQPKEAKLSARHGDRGDSQPASQLIPEKSSSKLSVQHGGFEGANLAVHTQPELCLQTSDELDRQALGLVSHSGTDSQQSAENLGSEKGTLFATNPPFTLEGSQSDIQGDASIAQTRICTREEQIKQSHDNIYPIAINVSEKSVLVDTGSDTSSSILYEVTNKSDIQKDSTVTLASGVVGALKGSEVILKSKGTGEVKALDTALESESMEVLTYSETFLPSVALRGAKEMEATSESVYSASNVTTIPKSANQADLSTVNVAHMSVAMEEVRIPEPTEKSLPMGNVERSLELGGMSRTLEPALKLSVTSDNLRVMQASRIEGSSVLKADTSLQHPYKASAVTAVTQVEIKSVNMDQGSGAVTGVKGVEPARSSGHTENVKTLEEALQPVAVGKPKSLETVLKPVDVAAKDVTAAREHLQAEVKYMEGTTGPATVLNVSGAFLQPNILTDMRNVDRTQESVLPAELTHVNVVAEAEGLRSALEPVGQTFAPQTVPEIQMVEDFKGPQSTTEVAALTGVKIRETSQAALQLENTDAPEISESTFKPVAVTTKDSEGTSLLRQQEELRELRCEGESSVRGPLSLQKEGMSGLGGVVRPVAVAEAETLKTVSPSLQMEGVKASKAVHCGTVARGLAATVGSAVVSKGSEINLESMAVEAGSDASLAMKVEASPGFPALEETSERPPESMVAHVSMEVVRDTDTLAGMMHLKTTADRGPKYAEAVAEPLGANRTESYISESQVMAHTRMPQPDTVGEIKGSELATSSATIEVRDLDNLEAEAVAEVKDVEARSETSHLTQMKNLEMVVGFETRALMEGVGRASEMVREMRYSEVAPEDSNKAKARSEEAVLEPLQTVTVQTLETSSKSIQEQIVGHSEAVLEHLPRLEEKTMASEMVTEVSNLRGTLESKISTDVRTQGPTVEYIIATRKTSTQKNEPSLSDVKYLGEASEMEKAVTAEYLEPASEAGELRLESMKESATVEVKGSETVEAPEVDMDIQGNLGAMNVLEHVSEAVPESLHTEKEENLQTVPEAKAAAEWKSTEEAPEILTAAEVKSSEAGPELGDMKHLETSLEHEVAAEARYAEVQCQQVEDVRAPGQAQEHEILVEKKDGEQSQTSEPFTAETAFSSSHAADEKETPESEIIRDAKQLEAAPADVAETKGLETVSLPDTVVELKDAEAAVELEAETQDLEAASVPETVEEAEPTPVAEAGQTEVIPQADAVKEATPEQDSEKRDSETSDVQPDVAARMKETLMRLEKVVEKSSHRSSDKKHDAKKQKRSRSKSQSRSRKRKKKSRSRSTSRRLTSKRARSRSRNYSVSRKKHSKSRSRSVEKRERRVSSRRSRRRRSRSSDHYRSKSRSAEKRGSRLSRRRRSRSSDRYRSKSRSVEKRLSSRRSRRRRSRSSDRYRSKSRSLEKRLSSRRSGRRRSRSSDRYRSKSRSVEKRLSSRRSGRRRSRSSDRYRSKSRSVEKRLSSRRSGRRRSRSSDRYRSKSRSVEKRGSRLSSWRSRRRRSGSSDRSKSRSRSSEKRGGKEYSWRFRHRGSGSSDRSKSRSRSVEKRGRKASLRRSKRQRSKSSDRYKSRSRSVEKRDRKQSSRKSKRQRSKSSDHYKSRSKSVEKKKESSRKSKRRRSKSSERYKSRSRSVEKKRKESSKKSKRKRSKSSDSVKSRSKSVEKRGSKLSSMKCSSKGVESSECQDSTQCLEEGEIVEQSSASEDSPRKSSNGPMSVALSDERVNGPELPPAFDSGFSKTSDSFESISSSVKETAGLQPSVVCEFDSSRIPDDQERSQVSELSVTSGNGSAEKAVALESSLPELACSTSKSRSSSVEKRDPEISSGTEFQLSASHEDESRSASVKEIEGPESFLTLESGCSVSSDDYKATSLASRRTEVQESLMSESVLSDLSDGHELGHTPVETTEPQNFLQVPESESSKLADIPESRSLSSEAAEAQNSFLAPEVPCSASPDDCESASLPVQKGQMQEPSLASDSGCFRSPDAPESRSSFNAQTEELLLMSESGSFRSPDGNEQRSLSVEKVKAPDVSLQVDCSHVEILDDLVSASSFGKVQEAVLTTVGQSCKSSGVHESRSSVDKDGLTLPQVLEIECSEPSEMHESRYLPAGKIEGAGSVLMARSGISVCHDGHKTKHNYFEKTEGAELLLASELRCSVFPENCELTSTAVEKMEMQRLESGFSTSADVCEALSTPVEKLQAPVTSLTSEGGLFLLPDSHELRPVPAEEVEVLKSSELKCVASPDDCKLRSVYREEIHVQEPPLIVESRCSVLSDGDELTSTSFEKVEVEEPCQLSANEYTIELDGPELTSTPAEKTELRELHQMSKERCSVSVESEELRTPLLEKIEVQKPALTSENEYAVSWEGQMASSSPEKVEIQEASVVPDSEHAVSSEEHELLSSLAEKTEIQECSLVSENEYVVSPHSQEVAASPAEKEVKEPSLTSDSGYTIFPEGQGLQYTLAEKTVVQAPSLILDSQYVASPKGQELHSAVTEKTEGQECFLLSENEYDVSPQRCDLRSSPVEKEEIEEPSETSESESSISTDSQELQSAAVGKTEVQELSLSEGECTMSPEGQELQPSLAEKVEAKEPSLTSENVLSPQECESRLTRAEKTEDMNSSLTSENDNLLSFEGQDVRFTTVQKADVQELSSTPENEHAASPYGQELRFSAIGKEGGFEVSALNDSISMSPDDLKAIPAEKMDEAMPSLIPESASSMSPDGYSVKSGPGEETGDLEPSVISERRHSTSSYQESHELKSPMEEEGLESSLTPEHRRSVSPEGHDRKSIIDEETDDREPSLTSEHRRSTSPDEHESRSSIGEEAEYLEQPLTTERRCSVSSDEHESRSTAGEEVEDAEPSLIAERRDSTSSDEHESRSTAGEDAEDGEPSLTAERRHSTSSDDRESRSTTGEETEDLEPSLTAEHRRSVSPDGRESRSSTGEEAEDRECSPTAQRRHSTSSDESESRSTAGEDVDDVEPSLTAERRDSTSSDDHESRSTTGEEAEDMEPSLTTEHRRSTSPDGRESRSTTGEEVDDAEPSLTAERRDSTSSDEHESRSTTGEEGEDGEPSLADEDKQDSMPLERSEEQDSSFVPESRRSESSEREKSRSRSVDKMSDKESSQRSTSRHSKSPTHQKSRSTSVEKVADRESSRRSRRRRSRSAAHPKSRSTSAEKTTDKESSRRSRRRRSRSTARQRSQSTSVEKVADKESSRRSRRRRSRSTARQRSRSKSVEKTADKESSRRSRSRRSRSSQRRSQRYDTESRSRRNRSRSVTRRRASRSKSNRRSRSSSLSRSRHRRRSRSRSASRRRRSLSRDRRKRSQRNRSRSTDRRRRRSDSRDRRISLRLRSRSRTPIRQRRSRSRGRRRSSSRSPIRLRRSRSSGRRRYSRSPDRRRSRSSEFSNRSPKRLTDLDKAQLLEIAKANAAAMCAKSGVPLPPSLMPLLSQKKDDKANQKSSRDTLKELTEKCKKIAQSTDDVIVNKPHVSDEEEEERPFYNHPFKLSEPKPIFFNLSTPSIKPAPPPQPKNQVSLSKEFPVSSGSQHRKKEADSVYGEWVPVEKGKEDSKDDVFPKPSIEGVDITTAMNDRAIAQKRLNENTFDLEAMCMLNRAQEQIDAWAQSNSIPGQFTGSTGAQILSSDELTNSGPQAWIRKDQFLRAAPVTGGMGAQLMRKMGWREGEGLGKNKEGSVEPIMVDFKTDRKGLVAVGEKAQKRSGHYVVMKDLSGKHPVSALMEICNKRRWSPPEFVLVDDSGPDHRKHFIFKVRVNGNEYRPTFASLNKKHAKATAATAALQAMGLVPKESMVNTTMFRSASHR